MATKRKAKRTRKNIHNKKFLTHRKQLGWGFLMGSPMGHKRRRNVVLTPHQKAHQKAWHSKKHM